MERMKIPPVRVEALLDPRYPYIRVKARSVEYEVDELPEFGGRGDRLTPLEAFTAGLASCEALMFKYILGQLGVSAEKLELKVEVYSEFEIGEGLKTVKVKYIVRGLDRETAAKVVKYVEAYCPIYRTLSKLNVIKSELEVL